MTIWQYAGYTAQATAAIDSNSALLYKFEILSAVCRSHIFVSRLAESIPAQTALCLSVNATSGRQTPQTVQTATCIEREFAT